MQINTHMKIPDICKLTPYWHMLKRKKKGGRAPKAKCLCNCSGARGGGWVKSRVLGMPAQYATQSIPSTTTTSHPFAFLTHIPKTIRLNPGIAMVNIANFAWKSPRFDGGGKPIVVLTR